jgi:hypothetical protein
MCVVEGFKYKFELLVAVFVITPVALAPDKTVKGKLVQTIPDPDVVIDVAPVTTPITVTERPVFV